MSTTSAALHEEYTPTGSCHDCGTDVTAKDPADWFEMCESCHCAVSLFHWFASSATQWMVASADQLPSLSRRMKAGEMKGITGFNLWRVPGPQSREYGIDHYAPQVNGREYMGWQRYKA